MLCLVLVTIDVRQHHFHKQKIYLLRIFSIDPASISVKKGLFWSKQHRSTRRNNSLHPGYLTSLFTRTNHNQSPDHRCLCLDLSGRITTPDRFSYHTGMSGVCCMYTNKIHGKSGSPASLFYSIHTSIYGATRSKD